MCEHKSRQGGDSHTRRKFNLFSEPGHCTNFRKKVVKKYFWQKVSRYLVMPAFLSDFHPNFKAIVAIALKLGNKIPNIILLFC